MNKKGEKDFKTWISLKEQLHYSSKHPSISNGEVWWASVGENVGSEICGKGKKYMRPVIIFRKLNKYSFLAIPLTSKNHKGSWYAHFELNNKKQTAVVSQIECMSILRLWRKIGELSNGDLQIVETTFKNLIK